MKKITFSFFMMILPFLGFAQINEGFEGATFPPTTPGNWITMDNGIGTGISWAETTDLTRVNTGAKAAIMDRENIGAGNTSIDWLVTPQITVAANSQLRFFTRQTLTGNNGSVYEIRVSTDPTQTNQAAYTTIQTWSESTLNATYNVYEEKTVSLAAYPAGTQLYIAFVKTNFQDTATTDGDRWLIDDARVVQQCLDPNILTVGNITPTSALLGWTNNGTATQWEVVVQPSGTGVPTGLGTSVSTTSYNYSPLTPGTLYEFYVRADCGSGNYSQWAGPINFNTTPAGSICSAPINITGLPYSHTSNTNIYGDEVDTIQGVALCGATPTTTNYLQGAEVFYSYTATFTGNITATMTPGTGVVSSSFFVYNGCGNFPTTCLAGVANTGSGPRNIVTMAVTAGQTYVFVISSSTTPAGGIPYTLIIQQKFCDPPTTLSANTITTTSANLSWVGPVGATTWEVAIQTAGSPIPAGSGTSTTINTNYPATGLTSATAYQYWVRADCGGGLFSPWAGPFLFSTEICDAAQKCNYVFRLTDSASDGWDGALMQVRQNGVVVTTLGTTFTSGGGPVNVTVPLCENYPFELFWHVAGSWPSEVGVAIINNFGQTIFTKPAGTGAASTTTPLYTTTFDCQTPACLQPTALVDTLPTTQGATLNWNPNGGTLWDIYVVPQNPPSPPPTAATIPTFANVSTRPFGVTGLNPDTTYLYYIRTVCGPGQNSVWSVVGDFTTLPTCSRPTTLVTTIVTPFTAMVNWTQPANPGGGTASTWEVIVLPCGSPAPGALPNPNPSGVVTSVKPYTFTGLTPVTCYNFYVRAVCSSTDSSPWSVVGTFNTPDINDECINSKPVPVNQNTNCTQTVFGTVAGATASPQANTCGATADNDDVWFHFTATATTHYISLLEAVTAVTSPQFYPNTAPGGLNYSLYRGNDCNALTQVSCRTTNGGMETGLIIGETYKIRVYSPGTAASTKRFEICVGTKVIYCENSIPVCAVNAVVLRNDVGVPALPNPISGSTTNDDVGCLGSAPSPTFYYLTVQTNGDYTYFMEQSTAPDFSNPATNGLDVDYVTWGPFPNVATACTSITVGNTRPSPLGCSFSAADTETFTLNGAIAGQVYVIMITNYTTSSSYPGKRGYIRITRTSGPAPLDCCPFAAFSYPGNFFCKDGGTTISPTIGVGSTAGTYSSTPGLVINSVTGVIDIAASTVGTYTVTSFIPGTVDCNSSTATWSITISNAAAATIAYSAPAFCRSITTAQPVTQTGTAGGYYYANPAGLTINSTTGAITPSTSLAGTYTVNYNVFVAGCPSAPFTTTVTITQPAVGTFNYGALPYCQNATNPLPVFTGGGIAGTFSSTPGLVINPTTGEIDLFASAIGTYTVTNTIAATGGCPSSTYTASITITAMPIATFAYSSATYCQNSVNQLPVFIGAGVAGTFTSTPGLVINSVTGEIDVMASTAGTYTITNTIPPINGCNQVVETFTITINPNPVATLVSSDTDATICDNEIASTTISVVPTNFVVTDATYVWTVGGSVIPGATGSQINPTVTGTYEVIITLNGCTNVSPITMPFTVNFVPVFTITPTNEVKCTNEAATLTVTPTNFTVTDPNVTYTWTLLGGGIQPSPNNTSSISVTEFGIYEVVVSNFGCSSTHQIEVSLDTANIPITTTGQCEGVSYIITAKPFENSYDPASVTYVWTNANGDVVGGNRNTLNVSQLGMSASSFPHTFTVTITTIPDGCIDTQTFQVVSTLCMIQKGISPNGDGDNEFFDLQGLGVKQLSIFNRYGTKVYSYANYSNQWKGQSDKGDALPDGTYYFVIEQNDRQNKTGWIYINR